MEGQHVPLLVARETTLYGQSSFMEMQYVSLRVAREIVHLIARAPFWKGNIAFACC